MVEVEARAAPSSGAEALEELRHRREAEGHVRDRDRRRLDREQRAAPPRAGPAPAARAGAPAAARAAPGRGGRSGRDSAASRSASQPARLLRAPVLGQPPRELLGRLLGLELGQLGLLLGEERARLQLEQRRDEDEELAAGVEVELLALGEPLDEREHDRGEVDLGRLELLLQDQRQEQVERALERVEIELELAHDHAREASGGSDAALRDRHRAARRGLAAAAGPRPRGRARGPATRRRKRSRRRRRRSRPRSSAAAEQWCDGSMRSSSSKVRPNE